MKKKLTLTESEFKKLLVNIVSEALTPSQYRPYMKKFNRERYSDIFKSLGDKYEHDRNYYRIYVPLEEVKQSGPISETETEVTKFLEVNGYKVLDYVKGISKYGDSKNTTSIGKILTRLKAEDLMRDFVSDEARKSLSSDLSKLMVAISRHPYDIAGSDTDRNWTNCMTMSQGNITSERVDKLLQELSDLKTKMVAAESSGDNSLIISTQYKIERVKEEINDRKEEGENVKYIINDVKEGSLVSYLINRDDKNITNPISVLNIKPYTNEYDDDDFILMSDNNMYGNGRYEFKSTVDKILKHINGDKFGFFCLKEGLYADSQPDKVNILSKEQEDFLDEAKKLIFIKLKSELVNDTDDRFNRALVAVMRTVDDRLNNQSDSKIQSDTKIIYVHKNKINELIKKNKIKIIESISSNVTNGFLDSKEDLVEVYHDYVRYEGGKHDLSDFVDYFFTSSDLYNDFIFGIEDNLEIAMGNLAYDYFRKNNID